MRGFPQKCGCGWRLPAKVHVDVCLTREVPQSVSVRFACPECGQGFVADELMQLASEQEPFGAECTAKGGAS